MATPFVIVIIIANLMIIGINLIFNVFNLSTAYIVLSSLIGTFALILITIIVAVLISFIPKKWFHENFRFFKISKQEQKFYDWIGIKYWKEFVPEFGTVIRFKKNKIYDKYNNEYILRFLKEQCETEILHYLAAFLGFGIIFIWPLKYCLNFAIPLAIVGAVLNILPALVQRYNRPKLIKLYEFNERHARQKLEKQKASEIKQKENNAPENADNQQNPSITKNDKPVLQDASAENGNSINEKVETENAEINNIKAESVNNESA